MSDYFDAIAHALAKESNERLAQRVKDGITAELPGDWHPEGTQTRVPTERQLHEAYVAAQELERRAGGKPEPIKTWEPVMTDADLLRFDEVVHGFSVVKAGRRVDPVEVKPVGGNLPEPDWWMKDDGSASIRHPLTTEEEMVVELPEDATLEELEETILKGMPQRGEEGVWHVPDAKELAEAKAALKVLVRRANDDANED